MKKSFTKFVFNMLLGSLPLLFLSNHIYAQCVALNVTGSSATAAACPSGGSITVTATGTGLTYRLISGPAGYSTATNSTGFFNSLNAGNYVVEITDACGVKATRNLTISNTYAAFSVTGATVSNVCNGSGPGGAVNITVTGGKAPYTYDVVPVASTPVYGAATGSTTFSKTVTAFGTYRIYAKDACGEVRTYDVMVNATQVRALQMWWEELQLDRPCGETMDGLPTVTWRLHLLDQNNTGISFRAMSGATYQIYKPAVANSFMYSQDNCTNTTGALLTSGTVSLANVPADDSTAYPVTIPQEDVILIFTNTCGQVFKYCYKFNQGVPLAPDAEFALLQQSCAASWNNQVINLNMKYVSNMTAPYTFLLTKANGQTITNTDGYFSNLRPANFPLSILITDACGRTQTKNYSMPVQGSALQFTVGPQWNFLCTNIKNTATAEVILTGGDLPGIAEATNITVTGGTVTAVPFVSAYSEWLPGYYISNLLAGYTYKVIITNLCGEKDSIPFTVPTDHWSQPVLDWNLTADVNALCGQNKSNITATSNFTGSGTVYYYLYNLISPNTVAATNITGVFNDVTPGNYKVKFLVSSPSWACPGKDIKDSVNVTVLADGAGQTITRKTITTCEVNGVPTAVGKAIVEVSGSGPFTYEIIKNSLVGTGAEVWTLSSSNNPGNSYTWNIPVAGDPSNTVYSFRTTDKCGNKVTTQGSLQPINPPAFMAQNNPCAGEMDYTLSIADYGGNFTYRWVKLPDVATTLGTSSSITFPGAYTAANNGTYRCYIDLAGCIQRYAEVIINSANCGAALPVKLISFNGSYADKKAQLQWISENEINFKHYEIEKSNTGRDFVKINMVPAKNNQGQINTYDFTDDLTGYTEAAVYYRLKIIDKDGKAAYSSIVRLSINNSTADISIYPNPVKNSTSIIFTSNITGKALMKIIDKTGRVLVNDKLSVQKGINAVKLPGTENLKPGNYILQVQTALGVKSVKFIKI
jgi:hypothetical protein